LEGTEQKQPAARIERPVFVVAPPCSGAAAVRAMLGASPDLTAVAREGDPVLAGMPALAPDQRGWDSERLTGTDLTPELGERVRTNFTEAALAGGATAGGDPVRVLDADPRNALRIPFLAAVFPQSIFVSVHREPAESLPAMLAAWEGGAAVTHPELPGWEGPPWSLLLTPEWRNLAGSSLPEIVVEQWRMATRILLGDLERLPPVRWCVVDHAVLGTDPGPEIERICEFAGVAAPESISPAPAAPDDEEAARRRADVGPVLDRTGELADRAREWIASPPAEAGAEAEPVDPNSPKTSPLRSVNSSNLAAILEQLGSSLMVTTYQTGKLVAVRRDGDGVNTHFRQFESPMGLDWRGGRLAIGTRSQVFEYHNVPSLLPKMQPPGKHDACFVPRRSHYTGDVRIHDVAYAGGELWLVATRFSCLATLDNEHSFVPRWRPPFISALAAEDRCHLNGLCVVDDQVRYVTALGTSDEAGGWRQDKARGGIVMDVPSNEIVAPGLSMPHSPTWYRDKLWVLESGEGNIGYVDLDTGKVETVAQLPGFTRGLSFAGPLAFVGLSEVRESATFGGIPLTGRLEERQCGVWVVNIETGQTIAFLRFEDLVQEIFAVKVLAGVRFPEVAEHGSDAVNLTYVVPDEALRETA
jgi:uncharacterized protein (TIGR03032 family)